MILVMFFTVSLFLLMLCSVLILIYYYHLPRGRRYFYKRQKGRDEIIKVAPTKVSSDVHEFIESLWDAFMENFNAFKSGKMKLEDETKYHLFSAPGPKQYEAFFKFFGFFENAEKQIWDIWENNKDYMYTHDFTELDDQSKPAILEFLDNLSSPGYVPATNTPITMVSGSFWDRHHPTRKKIISHFKILHDDKKLNLRILTSASDKEPDMDGLNSLLGRDSKFDIQSRIPIHFVMNDPYILFEFPHTESSVCRLNMLLDLDNMKYKKGKTKAQLLNFLNKMIKEAYK